MWSFSFNFQDSRMKRIPGYTLMTPAWFLRDWKVRRPSTAQCRAPGNHCLLCASLRSSNPNDNMWTLSPAGKVKQEPTLYREGPPYQRRGSLQLWQFLVTLLDDPANAHFIAWTGRGMEFKLIEPEEVSLGIFPSFFFCCRNEMARPRKRIKEFV